MNSRNLFYVRYLQSGLLTTDKKVFFNIMNIEKELFSFYPKVEEPSIVKIKLRWLYEEVVNLNKRNYLLSDFENLDKISPQIIQLINIYDKIIDDINLNNGQNQISLFKNLNKNFNILFDICDVKFKTSYLFQLIFFIYINNVDNENIKNLLKDLLIKTTDIDLFEYTFLKLFLNNRKKKITKIFYMLNLFRYYISK